MTVRPKGHYGKIRTLTNKKGQFAYITVGGLNQVKVFRTDDFSQVATIPVGNLPHGIWPSGDGTRVYVGLENADAMTAIDTVTNKVIATVPIGQAPQAVNYVPNAVPDGDGAQNTQSLGVADQATHIALVPVGAAESADTASAPTTVALFNQGLVQVLQASVTGLQPKQPYILALSDNPDGSGALEPLANFMTNPAGAAIVNTLGQIRQIVTSGLSTESEKRFVSGDCSICRRQTEQAHPDPSALTHANTNTRRLAKRSASGGNQQNAGGPIIRTPSRIGRANQKQKGQTDGKVRPDETNR